jgi:hypothetical protein
MTGKRVSEIPAPLVATNFLSTYRAAWLSSQPLFTDHQAQYAGRQMRWKRLILPFCDAQGHVDRLLVGNFPVIREVRNTDGSSRTMS